MQSSLENNALAFWAGLVLAFLGLAGAIFYFFVRTSTESLILPGPHLRLKHFVLCLIILVAGVVLANFARPRGSSTLSSMR